MDIDSGQPWSELSIRDLQDWVRLGTPVNEIAIFLCRDTEEVLAKIDELDAAGNIEIPDSGCRHNIADAVSAEILNWEGHVGVAYVYSDGVRDARSVGPEDWPVIRKLRHAGKLSYASDKVREGMDEIFRLGLDRRTRALLSGSDQSQWAELDHRWP
jgi:hypothetical protein